MTLFDHTRRTPSPRFVVFFDRYLSKGISATLAFFLVGLVLCYLSTFESTQFFFKPLSDFKAKLAKLFFISLPVPSDPLTYELEDLDSDIPAIHIEYNDISEAVAELRRTASALLENITACVDEQKELEKQLQDISVAVDQLLTKPITFPADHFQDNEIVNRLKAITAPESIKATWQKSINAFLDTIRKVRGVDYERRIDSQRITSFLFQLPYYVKTLVFEKRTMSAHAEGVAVSLNLKRQVVKSISAIRLSIQNSTTIVLEAPVLCDTVVVRVTDPQDGALDLPGFAVFEPARPVI